MPPLNLPQGKQQDWRSITVSGNTMVWDYVTGARSGVKLKVFVWTPPQYHDPANRDKKFPVLFLYPGGEGASYNTWVDDSTFRAMKLVKEGKTHPFIFVMPYMQVSKNLDTECMDLKGQPKVGTFMDTDLPAMVLANFRALPPGQSWGTIGDSSGAWCATSLAVRHPEIFRAAVSLGGYFEIQTPLKGAKDRRVRAQDPLKLVAGVAPPPVHILAMAGTKAGPDAKLARQFAAAAKPPTSVELLIQQGGTHTIASFRKIIPQSFDFLRRHLSATE